MCLLTYHVCLQMYFIYFKLRNIYLINFKQNAEIYKIYFLSRRTKSLVYNLYTTSQKKKGIEVNV